MNAAVEILRADAAALGIELADEVVARFDKYLALLNRWSASVNLVGTRDAGEIARVHLADSLAVLPHLGGARRLVDVGSGAGLPGAAIAIARPDLEITSLEPVHKKHAFQAAVRRELDLTGFTPLAERDEQHRASPDFRPYDLAVSRATWAIPEWLERGARLVRPGGRVLAMEGREQHQLPPGASRHPYRLGDRTRAVVVLDLP
ncbi:MAG TPA: 16S rRNA (guanine(527)-N(7))-methyltransferase RsmG [Kofleriaceae bacterium]|nr:16S rRNA (guanine(527)-N(7))-methyltransferase RsmG [Kofleriaceae bacterium]